jgi:NADH dehydrogenase [ubiquinone] 1 alpha subcomplex assembly factor 7
VSVEVATRAVSLHDYMASANAAYYAARDPFGMAGDFVTAPEISQMFGELIGLWVADLAVRSGLAQDCEWVELGPGRGTLTTDALRAMAKAGLAPSAHMVETSPVLRARQSEAVPQVRHHENVDSLPKDRPLIIIANEFFDALPIRQLVRTSGSWRERMVAEDDDRRAFILGAADVSGLVPPALADSPSGSIIELCPAADTIIAALGGRIARQGGALLIVDYGYEGPLAGDTLQAVAAHRFADPLSEPGTVDLTAHVDFAALAAAGRAAGLAPSPCVPQGAFLEALGIGARTQALTRANPDGAEAIRAAYDRLTSAQAMGRLFKVLALRAPGWPMPAGFA